MRLAAQYTNKDNPAVVIQVLESGGNLEIVEVGRVKRGCSGKLTSKINNGHGSSEYIALGALIIDTMFANPKGSGIGAILVYEYALHASRIGTHFLGINLVAGSDNGEPSPRPFYYKMGFWDTLDTAQMKMDAGFQSMPHEQQLKALTSLPMSSATLNVVDAARMSWSKQWERR
jgi:hypothetical protein